MKYNTEETAHDDIKTTTSTVQLSVDGYVVRLNFAPNTDSRILVDIKRMILNGLTRLQK